MAESNFVDYVKICCRSGKGGGGSRHFRREKFIERGGPDGGDGGRGGHIIVKGSKDVWTLLHLKYRKHVIAEDGEAGAGAKRTGAQGEDEILKVPLGTVAKDFETGRIEFEITEEGQEYVLVSGGRGGLGNDHFKTSTNQAPDYAQPGEPGKEEWKILELKVLADVGLVGFPNAGKSTLMNTLVNEDRAIVTNIEGTTRDIVESTLLINGVKVKEGDKIIIELADVALLADIRKFETLGTRSFPIEQGIGEAVNFHMAIGAKRKEERVRYLKNYWATKAAQIPGVKIHTSLKDKYACAICGVTIDGMTPAALDGALYTNYKIHTVGIVWENISCVRITPHVYTRLEDLDKLVAALTEIAAKQKV